MSGFTFQPTHHSLLDSVFMPKNTTNMSNYLGHESNTNNTNCTRECVEDGFLDSKVQESSQHVACSDNDPSVTKKQNTESNSSVVDMLENGEQVTQRLTNIEKKRKNKYLSSLSSAQSKGNEGEMSKKQKKSKCVEKNEQEKKPKAVKKVEKKTNVEPPTGYIHVRARRGQATDSHSLAERVRREKISERMKVLQSIVPGCEKVAGKALVLDEIINYVQSLQNQVEFLSMKLASLNPMFFDFGMDLDAFTLDPQRVNSMPALQQYSPTQPISTTFTDSTSTTTLNTTNNYPLLDSSSFLPQQEQRPHATAFSQDGGSLAWDVLDLRQKFLNPSDFANNLCSFH